MALAVPLYQCPRRPCSADRAAEHARRRHDGPGPRAGRCRYRRSAPAARYWVSTPTVSMPELTQLDRGKSMMRYFPPKGTAGFATFWSERTGGFPARRPAAWQHISFFILKNHLSHILCRNGGQALSGRSSVFCQFLLGSGALALCGRISFFSCVPDPYGCTAGSRRSTGADPPATTGQSRGRGSVCVLRGA